MMLAEIVDTSYSQVHSGLIDVNQCHSDVSTGDISIKQISDESRFCSLR